MTFFVDGILRKAEADKQDGSPKSAHSPHVAPTLH